MISKRKFLIYGGSALAAAAIIPAVPAILPNAMNTYSHGWRMGQLASLDVDGYGITTGEGALLLGDRSTRRVDNGVTINPWSFSMTRANYERFRVLQGQRVAVRYRQRRISPPFLTFETDYIAEDVVAVNGNLAPATRIAVPGYVESGQGAGDRRAGSRSGAIVKVSTKGSVFKSWEMSFQTGSGSNDFIDMTIHNEAIFDAAVMFLKSGVETTISYQRSMMRNPMAGDTNFEVVAIRKVGVA